MFMTLLWSHSTADNLMSTENSCTSICTIRNFTWLPWELPWAAYKAKTIQKSYKGSFPAAKKQLILHSHGDENSLNISIYILHYLCTQRSFVQNNPGRITKMTKNTCNKIFKKQHFPTFQSKSVHCNRNYILCFFIKYTASGIPKRNVPVFVFFLLSSQLLIQFA